MTLRARTVFTILQCFFPPGEENVNVESRSVFSPVVPVGTSRLKTRRENYYSFIIVYPKPILYDDDDATGRKTTSYTFQTVNFTFATVSPGTVPRRIHVLTHVVLLCRLLLIAVRVQHAILRETKRLLNNFFAKKLRSSFPVLLIAYCFV